MIKSLDQVRMEVFAKNAEARGYTGQLKEDYVQESVSRSKKTGQQQDAVILTGFAAAGAQALHKAKTAKMPILQALKEHFGPVAEAFKNGIKQKPDILGKTTLKDVIVTSFKKTGEVIKAAYKTVPKPVRLIGAALIALGMLNHQIEQNKSEAKYDAVQYIKDNA